MMMIMMMGFDGDNDDDDMPTCIGSYVIDLRGGS
jgi:hypothetical protein